MLSYKGSSIYWHVLKSKTTISNLMTQSLKKLFRSHMQITTKTEHVNKIRVMFGLDYFKNWLFHVCLHEIYWWSCHRIWNNLLSWTLVPNLKISKFPAVILCNLFFVKFCAYYDFHNIYFINPTTSKLCRKNFY